MSKITTEHLARSAHVYIRQSMPDQLAHNHESRRRQYDLANRARQLGWTTVEVIDDDLGRSGGGTARPGFERLLAAICESRVGAVLAIEHRDWPVTVVTGIRWSNSADWSGPSSSTRMESMILAIPMTDCCSE